MNPIPLLIFGASGHARVIIDMAERSGRFNIIGLLDSIKPVGELLMDHSVLGNESILPELVAAHPGLHIHIAIGDNGARERITHQLAGLSPNIAFATIIDPSAIVSRSAIIGQGSCVMPGAIINANTIIGQQCIVNSRAVLEHDGKMSHFSSLGPGALAAGGSSLGHAAAVLTGGVIKHGVALGDHAVALTGAVVVKDSESCTVMEGNPATIKGYRNPGDRYL